MSTLTFNVPGDVIDSLPTDGTVPNHNEIQILDALFLQNQSKVNRILTESKDVLILALLFILFSLPQIDPLIHKLVPYSAKSPYVLLGVKTVLFSICYFIIKNWYLVRNKK